MGFSRRTQPQRTPRVAEEIINRKHVIASEARQSSIINSNAPDPCLTDYRLPGAFDFLPNIVLLEAKDWSNAVGSIEVAWFDRKLQNRGLDFGILVALNCVTGDAADRTSAHQIIAGCLREQRRLVVLTNDDLSALRDTGALVTLIKTKLCELAVTGTLFS